MRCATTAAALVMSGMLQLFGQSSNLPSFEVVSIKHNNSGNNAIGGHGVCLTGGRVSVSNIPLNLIIEQAYGVKEFQVQGRPSWLTSERFDIEAKPGSPVKYDECTLMLRALLADRFKLAVHRETRQSPIYKLLVAKSGPKLHQVSADAPLGIKTFSTTTGQLITRGSSMAQLAAMLAQTGELENLVIDSTGLAEYYQFTLEWTPSNRAATEGIRGPSLFTALQEQLGLRLEAGKAPVQFLVIDRIDKTPTAN